MTEQKLKDLQARARQLSAAKAERKLKAAKAGKAYGIYLDARRPFDRTLAYEAYQRAAVDHEIAKDIVGRLEKQFKAAKAGK